MRCGFSPSAELDLEEIGDYIARDNPRRAVSFIAELKARCLLIVHAPYDSPFGKNWAQASVWHPSDPVNCLNLPRT